MVKYDSVLEGLCDSVTNLGNKDGWYENDRLASEREVQLVKMLAIM
jgi:hypothetical protein